MTGDFEIGGGWGRHVSLFRPDVFEATDLNTQTVTVWGHSPKRPQVGQTLLMECVKSWILFRFESVEYKADPPDMFFAEVRAIEQKMKSPPQERE